MTLALIVACSRNGVIGKDNGLPWHLPEDLKHFKAVTMGKPMIMGRKTYDSIGRPLPGRTTLVVTRQPDWAEDGVVVCHSVAEAIARAEALLPAEGGEIMVVGGEQIYRQCLPLADVVYLTEVAVEVEGDAFFPSLEEQIWRTRQVERGFSEKAGLQFAFLRLERC